MACTTPNSLQHSTARNNKIEKLLRAIALFNALIALILLAVYGHRFWFGWLVVMPCILVNTGLLLRSAAFSRKRQMRGIAIDIAAAATGGGNGSTIQPASSAPETTPHHERPSLLKPLVDLVLTLGLLGFFVAQNVILNEVQHRHPIGYGYYSRGGWHYSYQMPSRGGPGGIVLGTWSSVFVLGMFLSHSALVLRPNGGLFAALKSRMNLQTRSQKRHGCDYCEHCAEAQGLADAADLERAGAGAPFQDAAGESNQGRDGEPPEYKQLHPDEYEELVKDANRDSMEVEPTTGA